VRLAVPCGPCGGAAKRSARAAARAPCEGKGWDEHASPPPALPPRRPRCGAALRGTLARHQAEAQAGFDALFASQKRLSASLRALHAALDGVLALAAPRADGAALDQLRAAAGRSRALQARLRGVAARLDRVEAALAAHRPHAPPA
jgi:hypothetical protein